MLQICDNIKYFRLLHGFTKEEIAQKLGVHLNTYGNWEVKTQPSIEVIKQIAAIHGVHYTQIIDRKDELVNSIQPDQQLPPDKQSVAIALRKLAEIVEGLDCSSIGQMPEEENTKKLKEARDSGMIPGKGKPGKGKTDKA